ncbi:heme exporter protein CcmD [Aestuariibacter sp. A3R04]|uniref:heme exporter protein CcmD n=1 Tax=Aestuariibacter sp. A3R04 TaxID=2841571 RepID=UPI001C09969C|nr:heme exporter protein CcmD [Aestuariibacter sp. A3R04]MBU3022082.1 heme exporter protein CcmD [Aestuariibacter sp. A3R04]
MQFDSMGDFWAMGGYGFYVWISFGFTVVCLLAIVAQTLVAERALMKQITTEKQRKARIKNAECQRKPRVSIPSVSDKAEK